MPGSPSVESSAEDSKLGFANVLAKPMAIMRGNFKTRDDAERSGNPLDKLHLTPMKAVLSSIASMSTLHLDALQEVIPPHLNFCDNTAFVDQHRQRLAISADRWADKSGEEWRRIRAPSVTMQIEELVRSVTGESLNFDSHEPASSAAPPPSIETLGFASKCLAF